MAEAVPPQIDETTLGLLLPAKQPLAVQRHLPQIHAALLQRHQGARRCTAQRARLHPDRARLGRTVADWCVEFEHGGLAAVARGTNPAAPTHAYTPWRRLGHGRPTRSRLRPSTMGFNAWLSWVLAAEKPTRRGSPAASDRTCILEPGLPRSTGLGPVSSPPF